jgi:hypothetical protein
MLDLRTAFNSRSAFCFTGAMRSAGWVTSCRCANGDSTWAIEKRVCCGRSRREVAVVAGASGKPLRSRIQGMATITANSTTWTTSEAIQAASRAKSPEARRAGRPAADGSPVAPNASPAGSLPSGGDSTGGWGVGSLGNCGSLQGSVRRTSRDGAAGWWGTRMPPRSTGSIPRIRPRGQSRAGMPPRLPLRHGQNPRILETKNNSSLTPPGQSSPYPPNRLISPGRADRRTMRSPPAPGRFRVETGESPD